MSEKKLTIYRIYFIVNKKIVGFQIIILTICKVKKKLISYKKKCYLNLPPTIMS